MGSEEKSVDLSLLTLAYISKDAFRKLSPQEQAFNLEILARYCSSVLSNIYHTAKCIPCYLSQTAKSFYYVRSGC